MNIFTRIPDGRFVKDMVVYGYPEEGYVSKGYRVIPPYLSESTIGMKNEYHQRLRMLLKGIKEKMRLQIQWSCDGNYIKELNAYQEETEKSKNEYIKEQRGRRYCYFREKIKNKELRREELVFFPILPIKEESKVFTSSKKQTIIYNEMFEKASDRLEEMGNMIKVSLGNDCIVEKLSKQEMYEYNKNFFNPHIKNIRGYKHKEIDNRYTIMENCLNSDIVKHGSGFCMGGYYHSVITFSRWPDCTYQGKIDNLTHLPIQDYRLTLNIKPMDKEKEVTAEKKLLKRLIGDKASKPEDIDLDVSINKKTKKIYDLKSGDLRPYEVEYIIRLWDETEKGLKAKEQQVILGISGMDGAEPFISTLYSTTKKTFFHTFPGYYTESYPHRRVYAQDDYLADLIPLSATFTGNLEGAEALYDGDQQNIVGMKGFINNTPQHAVLFGMSGAGKSVHMQDFLEQTAPYFAYTAIIDDGLSYKKFTEKMGEKPIIIHPSGELTINYFDTRRLPLTADHFSFIVTLVSSLVGKCESDEKFQLRSAQLGEYLKRTYENALRDWETKNLNKLGEIKRMSYATHIWKKEKLNDEQTYAEAFLDLDGRIGKKDEETIEWINGLREEDIIEFSTNPRTSNFYRDLSFAYFDPREFPTHTNLIETIKGHQLENHNKQEVLNLATLLTSWSKEGQYGKLFDGTSNIDLKKEVVHFELQQIPKGLEMMKLACGLLLTGVVRQHIVSMPRNLRKRIIFEEVSNFLNIPYGERIVGEAYAQLRKYSCQAISIVQQYAQFKNTAIRPVVIGNSKQFWIMKQRDKSDLEDMSEDIHLSESMQNRVQNFTLPEHQADEFRHSSICYFSPESKPMLCGVVKNYQIQE